MTWPSYADVRSVVLGEQRCFYCRGILAPPQPGGDTWVRCMGCKRRWKVRDDQIMVQTEPVTDPPPWVAGQRLPFEGGYWLVECVRYDGEHGWRFEITPVLRETVEQQAAHIARQNDTRTP